MIVDAHAIIDPRTVMIEPLNASVASRTVFRSWGPHDFAVRAHFSWMHLFE